MREQLELYASVCIHDKWERWGFVESLKKFGIEPRIHNDYVEIRYTGSRDVTMRIADLCDSKQFHSIHVSATRG